MIKVVPFVYNVPDDLAANTYLVIDSDNKCAIIDPSVDYDGIVSYLKKNDIEPLFVLLTHGHFDHFKGVKRIVDNYHIPVYISYKDAELLKNSYLNCAEMVFKIEVTVDVDPILVDERTIIKGLEENIQVIETPYHTSGSVCFYLKDSKMLFSGDSLFKKHVGRTDLPTSEPRKFKDSINKLFRLPDDVKVYPGHGKNTLIGDEKSLNPFIN